MAEPSATPEHVYRLSSIDQSLVRVYIRYGLCFAHLNTDIEATTNRLIATVKRTVTHLPILAGAVRPVNGEDSQQSGRVEVAVTLQDVASFKPIIKVFNTEEFPYTYEDLAKAGMPPSALICQNFTPLPDVPNTSASPVFALQANFIPEGLIVALYLHQSVADIVGMRTVISHLSSDLPSCKLTCQDLKDEAMEQSRLRDRLSGSRGVKSDMAVGLVTGIDDVQPSEEVLSNVTLVGNNSTCRVFSFDLNLIQGTTGLINERFHCIHNDLSVGLTAFDTLVAILWKGINRAQPYTEQNNDDQSERNSAVIVPVNIRKRIEPPLDDSFFGNATVQALPVSGISRLSVPFEIGTLAHTARLIRTAMITMSEQRVRSVIANINESDHVQCAPSVRVTMDTNLVIANWEDLPLEEADLGLGIGHPGWVRKFGGNNGTSECIVHPVKKGEGLWEVTVELKKSVIDSLLEDEGFMSFVVLAA